MKWPPTQCSCYSLFQSNLFSLWSGWGLLCSVQDLIKSLFQIRLPVKSSRGSGEILMSHLDSLVQPNRDNRISTTEHIAHTCHLCGVEGGACQTSFLNFTPVTHKHCGCATNNVSYAILQSVRHSHGETIWNHKEVDLFQHTGYLKRKEWIVRNTGLANRGCCLNIVIAFVAAILREWVYDKKLFKG